jgi:hypothetical protein
MISSFGFTSVSRTLNGALEAGAAFEVRLPKMKRRNTENGAPIVQPDNVLRMWLMLVG